MPAFQPGPVPREAVDFLESKDLRVGFDYRDVWGREHATSFTVAKATRLDILDDLRSALEENLAEGKTFRDFAQRVRPELERKGWWGIKEETDPQTGERRQVRTGTPHRLRTIYRSNMRSARAAGQWERGERRRDTHPYWLYTLGPSREHREQHVGWAGTMLPKDDPWWDDHFPPNGYGCKCGAREVSQGEADRLQREGIQDPAAEAEIDEDTGQPTGRRRDQRTQVRTEAPPRNPQRYVNRRTGEVTEVDDGVHPAWATNPGKDRTRVIRNDLTGKTARIQDDRYARASVNQVMRSPILDEWMERPEGELPAGALGSAVRERLGTETQVVRLTSVPDGLDVEDLRALPELLAGGTVVRRGERISVYQRRGEQWWRADVRADSSGRRLELGGYEPVEAGAVERERAEGEVLREAGE